MEQLLEFSANHPWLIAAAIGTAAILLYNELRVAGQGKFMISPDQAVRLMNKGAVVVDLRKPEDFQTGHLSGAKNLPLADLDAELESLKRYRGKTILAYDDKGLTAPKAISRFRQAEFEHVFSLRGGVAAWRADDLPLERKQGKS